MPLIRSLLLPALALAVVALLDGYGDPEWISREVALTMARVTFALVFLLGLRFRRGRSAFTALLLASLTELLHFAGSSQGPLAETLEAARILVPLNLAVFAGLGEFALLSRRGALRCAAVWTQVGLISPLGLSLLIAAGAPKTLLGIERLEALSFGLSAIILLALVGWRRNALAAGWLAALVALWLAFHGARESFLLLFASGLVLGLALVQDAFALAFEDGLTGLPGRRALDERLLELSGPYALAMVDLDHFKQVNDRYGHDVGDQVLRRVASRLRSITGGGVAYRYGGEEFTVLFAGCGVKEAKAHLESFRQQIARQPFTVRSDRPSGRAPQALKITTSIGLAERGSKRRPPQDVLKAADTALYRAKRGGRNRLAVTTR